MSLSVNEKRIIFQSRDELMVVEPYGENIIRVRSTRNRTLSEEGCTLLPPGEDCATARLVDESTAVIENGIISVEAKTFDDNRNCELTFFKNGKKVLKTNEGGLQRSWGMTQAKYEYKGGNNYKINVKFEANEDEHIYGLGHERGISFDRKNSSCELIQYNTKATVPVVYSSLGYGFFWNNPSLGRCEFTKNQTQWTADNAYQADWLVFVGENPGEVMENYGRLTGFAPMMPEWVGGFWQSKLRYESQEDLLEVARKYKEKNLPIDAIIIDYFHWTEQGDWDFDPELWPDPKGMCRELEKMNIHPAASVWPTINGRSKNFRHMDWEGMLVATEGGQSGLLGFYGSQFYIDPTNPKTREYQWEQVKKSYYSYGIKSYWLDATEPEIYPQQFDNLRFYTGNGESVALAYPFFNQKTFYEGLKKEGEDHSVLLTRCAYAGSQRFGAIVWNGDIPSTFEALKESVVSGLSMAMSGIPWWNSDIGGFFGGDIESDYFRELVVRWFQFGLFCPVMRLHGNRKKPSNHVDRHPGIPEMSGGDNEIWSFGEETYEILKKILGLRERLKPYTMSLAKEASEKGAPLMRPMFFEFPEDEECYKLDDQYMYGPHILFAPIYEYGQTKRMVYLPRGEWVRISDKTVTIGGKFVECKAKKDEFIAFVKKGAEVLDVF